MNYLTPRFDWLPCDLHAACGPRATIRGGVKEAEPRGTVVARERMGRERVRRSGGCAGGGTGFHYLELAAGCLNLSSVIPT